MALTAYLNDVSLLLNDPNNLFFSQATLTNFINKARNRVAQDTQCVRVIVPSTSTILTVGVSSGGSGYTSPTVVISSPDAINGGVQATATATVAGGTITAINIVVGGTGYVAIPSITVTDPTGSGFVVGAISLSPSVTTIVGQEAYSFSTYTSAVQYANPAVGAIYALQSVSVSWGSMKPTLDYKAWTTFQARYRAYNIGQQNYPSIWSQHGRGAGGQCWLFPVPGIVSQMEWDAYCLPIALVNDSTPEAIPDPFTESVKYYATHLAHLNAQRRDDAQYYMSMYTNHLIENGVAVTPSYSPSAYDGDD
jgi:hypothetical protein